jgi:hypothetical protein
LPSTSLRKKKSLKRRKLLRQLRMPLPRWKLSQQRRTRRVKILIKLIFAIEKDPAIAGIKGPLSAYLIFSNKRRPIIQ